MAEVVRTAPAEFIEAAAKTYLDDLTKGIGTFKTTDLSNIMGPQLVAGPSALTTQSEAFSNRSRCKRNSSKRFSKSNSLSGLHVTFSTRCY